ncbi:MAG: hypothetical protein EAX89_13425, partial [Candidatus Lokiarchaeota archaeon]|nr:hypothetical protein [Candidatus Lokiarchaeota archaeon]
YEKGYLTELLVGMGFGFIISGLVALLAKKTSAKYDEFRDPIKWSRTLDRKKLLDRIDLILFKPAKAFFFVDKLFLNLPRDEQEKLVSTSVVSLASGSLGLWTGAIATTLIWDPDTRKALQLKLAISSFALAGACLIAALVTYNMDL